MCQLGPLTLVAIGPDGRPRGHDGELPAVASEVLRATGALYDTVGYRAPWVGYLALVAATPVGTCGFKTPPAGGRVEVAYFTFPGFEGRGVATGIIGDLVRIAWSRQESVEVAAQTLPEASASTRILEKLGFRRVGSVDHPEDGRVWEWRRAPGAATMEL